MLLCCNCFQKDCKCDKPRFEEIDNNIVDNIILLNNKGYKTVACCEGHKESKIFDLYIMFMNELNVEVPEPFKLSKNKKILRFTKNSEKITDEQIKELREILHKWIEAI